jgi:hypothetical protein
MSFSDPAHIIDHIPRDFDMKAMNMEWTPGYSSDLRINPVLFFF